MNKATSFFIFCFRICHFIYYITSLEKNKGKTQAPLSPNMRLLVDTADKLSAKGRRLAVKLVKVLGGAGGRGGVVPNCVRTADAIQLTAVLGVSSRLDIKLVKV